MRTLALVLTVAIAGLPVAPLACGWTCFDHREQVAATGAGCHDHDAPESSATASAPHVCHQLVAPDPFVPTQPSLATVVNPDIAAGLRLHLANNPGTRLSVRPSAASHAPPSLLVPLRI